MGEVLDRTIVHSNSRNLLLHEVSIEDDIVEPLRVAIDCWRSETYNTAKRNGRISQALGYVLRQRWVAGWFWR